MNKIIVVPYARTIMNSVKINGTLHSFIKRIDKARFLDKKK